jgi:hypothetical protein
MDETPKRRPWFRYSLRTLFVLVTLLCVWLGVQAKWIRDRRGFIAEEQVKLESLRKQERAVDSTSIVKQGNAPGFLGLFGERGVAHLSMVAESPMPERLRKRLDEALVPGLALPQAEHRRRVILIEESRVPIPLTLNAQNRVELAKRIFPEATILEVLHVMKRPGDRDTIISQPANLIWAPRTTGP